MPFSSRMRRALLLLAFFLLPASSGCTLRDASAAPPTAAFPPPTATWTPFAPLPPTPTYLPTSTATPTNTPPPTATPLPTATPTPKPALPVKPIPHAGERINIMLLGSDRRPGHADFRTDAFMLLSYNPKTGATSIISIPRDTYALIPGFGFNRINTAMEFGGFPLLAATMQYNFGVRPSHYVLVNFQGFATLVDALGGLNIYVPHQLCDRRTHYGQHYCVGPGTVYMDGSLALWYARSRITTSDFDRAHRQQALLLAMIRKLLSLNALAKAPSLYKSYRQTVQTDIGFTTFLNLLAQARHFNANAIRTYVIQPPALRPWTTPRGSYVLLQNYPAVRRILQEALSR